MSQKNIQAFFESAAANPELKAHLDEISTAAAREIARKLSEASKAAGFPFTAEELLASNAESLSGLSDEQLSGVVGGKIGSSDVPDNMLSLLTALRAATGG